MSNREYVRRLINAIYYLDGLYEQGGKLSGVEGNMTVFCMHLMMERRIHKRVYRKNGCYLALHLIRL